MTDAIDLRSDTVTTPGDAMRAAARDAAVGDDVYGEDPTVNELEATAADRLGTAAALFFPSGTMANQTAARVHTDRDQEVIVERESHIYKWEVGGLAQHAGLQIRPVEAAVDDGGGIPAAGQVADAHVEADLHRPGTGLVCLENTHNSYGGLAAPPATIEAVAEVARERDVPVHLDGARLFNAAVARDVSVTAFTEHVDSVMISLSKGLGAPVGSLLAGTEATIERARRIRKLLGGGMRQAGLIAAPALLAFENVSGLAADHERARRLAAGIDTVDGLSAPVPETNIVLVDTGERTAESFLDGCERGGVLGSRFGDRLVRFCTHRDLTDADIETAIEAIDRCQST